MPVEEVAGRVAPDGYTRGALQSSGLSMGTLGIKKGLEFGLELFNVGLPSSPLYTLMKLGMRSPSANSIGQAADC